MFGFSRRLILVVVPAVLALGAAAPTVASASDLGMAYTNDPSHCDRAGWYEQVGLAGINYWYEHDYVAYSGIVYQEYNTESVTPNPEPLGEPNVDTWITRNQCGYVDPGLGPVPGSGYADTA